VDDDHWMRLSPTLYDRVLRRPLSSIMATRSAERARSLFSEGGWSQQQQIGFLLREGQLPMLTRQLVVTVLDARNVGINELGLPEEIVAVIMPAVDGDYLHTVAREQSTQDAICAAVAAECESRGIPFGARQVPS
jgi:hypothetical protein